MMLSKGRECLKSEGCAAYFSRLGGFCGDFMVGVWANQRTDINNL